MLFSVLSHVSFCCSVFPFPPFSFFFIWFHPSLFLPHPPTHAELKNSGAVTPFPRIPSWTAALALYLLHVFFVITEVNVLNIWVLTLRRCGMWYSNWLVAWVRGFSSISGINIYPYRLSSSEGITTNVIRVTYRVTGQYVHNANCNQV